MCSMITLTAPVNNLHFIPQRGWTVCCAFLEVGVRHVCFNLRQAYREGEREGGRNCSGQARGKGHSNFMGKGVRHIMDGLKDKAPSCSDTAGEESCAQPFHCVESSKIRRVALPCGICARECCYCVCQSPSNCDQRLLKAMNMT